MSVVVPVGTTRHGVCARWYPATATAVPASRPSAPSASVWAVRTSGLLTPSFSCFWLCVGGASVSFVLTCTFIFLVCCCDPHRLCACAACLRNHGNLWTIHWLYLPSLSLYFFFLFLFMFLFIYFFLLFLIFYSFFLFIYYFLFCYFYLLLFLFIFLFYFFIFCCF